MTQIARGRRLRLSPLSFGGLAIALLAWNGVSAGTQEGKSVKLGEKLVIHGRVYYVESITDGKLVLSPPRPPTASMGAFRRGQASTTSTSS